MWVYNKQFFPLARQNLIISVRLIHCASAFFYLGERMNVFEENYYDEYDFYNIMPIENLFTRSGGKGRTKTEIQTRR